MESIKERGLSAHISDSRMLFKYDGYLKKYKFMHFRIKLQNFAYEVCQQTLDIFAWSVAFHKAKFKIYLPEVCSNLPRFGYFCVKRGLWQHRVLDIFAQSIVWLTKAIFEYFLSKLCHWQDKLQTFLPKVCLDLPKLTSYMFYRTSYINIWSWGYGCQTGGPGSRPALTDFRSDRTGLVVRRPGRAGLGREPACVGKNLNTN